MPSTPSQFVWYELMSPDPEAAARFYQAVLGWSAQPHPGAPPDMPYLILSMEGVGLGGIMALAHAGEGAKPAWVGYIGVNDVDALAIQVTEAGGVVHRAPADIPGVGRFAVAADPSGAVFMLFKAQGEAPQQSPPPGAPGFPGWRELYADDGAAAFDFYAGLFGWTKAGDHDMGPMGVYHLFAAGGPAIGGMMTKPPHHPAAHWTYYFNVETVEAAVGRVQAAGGKVVNGPHEVPGGGWIAQCQDPQGAMFAVTGPK